MKWTYLLIDLFTILLPFLFSFHPRIRFNRYFFPYILANIISGTIFLAWDSLFTAAGVWSFNPDYISGLHLLNLPLEEILFFFCIPYACVFTYFCFSRFLNIRWKQDWIDYVLITLVSFLLITGLMNLDRAYTAMTFLSTGLILLSCRFIFQVDWLDKVFISYLVLLLPFLLVNGLLTGSGLANPVVSYNNEENLAIRLLTIPIEDVFYGFELFLVTVLFFEKLKPRQTHSTYL